MSVGLVTRGEEEWGGAEEERLATIKKRNRVDERGSIVLLPRAKKKGGEEGEKKGEGERISLLNIVSRFIDRPVR